MGVRPWTSLGIASLLVVGAPSIAAADGGQKPSTAPAVTIGQPYFGDNTDYGCGNTLCRVDMWRLPSLLSQDVITVAWRHMASRGPRVCVAGNIDDYSWLQDACNLATPEYGDDAGKRTVLTVSAAAPAAYLQFIDKDCFGSCGYYGPYQFTVETVQHALGLSLQAVSRVARKGTVMGTAALTDGTAPPDGMAFRLAVKRGKVTLYRTAALNGGRATFRLRLPRAWRGKAIAVTMSREADPNYLAASTQTLRTKVRKR